MTRRILRSRRPSAKEQIPEAGSEGNGNHDPAVIRHEDKPAPVSRYSALTPRPRAGADLHDHESVEVLQPVQNGLDDVRSIGDGDLVLP